MPNSIRPQSGAKRGMSELDTMPHVSKRPTGRPGNDPTDARRRLSAQGLLLAYVLIPMVLATGIFVWLMSSLFEHRARMQLEEQVRLVSRAVLLPLGHALENERPGAVGEVLRSLASIQRLYSIDVYNQQRHLVTSTNPSTEPSKLAPQVTLIREEGLEQNLDVAGRTVYSYTLPITTSTSDDILGWLRITRREREIRAQAAAIRYQGLLLGGAALLIIGAVVLVGHRRAIGEPLRRIGGAVREIERVQDNRVPTGGPREIQRVGDAINRMLTKLETAEQHLAERREREINLERKMRQREKLAVIGQLAGGVAHELGTPLSVIDGQAQRLLRDPASSPALRSKLETIRAEVERVSATVRQLLDVGRETPGDQREWVSVRSIGEAAMKATAATLDTQHLTLSFDGNCLDAPICVDRMRIEQALLNILRNAVQASPAAGAIHLRADREGNGIRWIVTDEGTGVAPQHRERLLEPFFTTKDPNQGTGLGLSVVHGIAKTYDGELLFRQREHRGTEVQLMLPAVFEEQPT